MADRAAAFGGSRKFIISFSVFIVAWIAINTILVVSMNHAFDPLPFTLLNLLLAMVAALQVPVIMMSQNRQGYKDRLKADIEYEVNLQAAREIGHLHQRLDQVYEQMHSHFALLEKGVLGQEPPRVQATNDR